MERDPFGGYYEALEKRHLAELTFAEVRRALQALSSVYVERRERMAGGAAFEGAGKRAAFALYYGPLHFLVVREIVRALPAPVRPGLSSASRGRGSRASIAAGGRSRRRGGRSRGSGSTGGRHGVT